MREYENDKCVGQSISSCQADGKLGRAWTWRQIDTIRSRKRNRRFSLSGCEHACMQWTGHAQDESTNHKHICGLGDGRRRRGEWEWKRKEGKRLRWDIDHHSQPSVIEKQWTEGREKSVYKSCQWSIRVGGSPLNCALDLHLACNWKYVSQWF